MQLFPEVGGSGDAREVVMHDNYRKVTFGHLQALDAQSYIWITYL